VIVNNSEYSLKDYICV